MKKWVIGGLMMFLLFGCSAEKYKIDFHGSEFMFEGVKETYTVGEEVVLYYTLIASDTDYSFELDGEGIKYNYDDKKGFVISFTMPNHDVSLVVKTNNSMEYLP